MSTVTPTPISENDPRLTATQPDYSAVHFADDGTPCIADRYLNLSSTMQRYVLALARAGLVDRANRVARCCRTASVVKRCSRGKFAVAHHHHCGDYFCINDSSGRWRFNKWAGRRDHAAFRVPHQGIELKLSRTPASHLDAMAQLRAIAAPLIDALTEHSFSVNAFAEHTYDCSVRIVYPGAHSYSEIRRLLAGSEVHVMVKRGTTEELGHWAFNGFHECTVMDADAKARLRLVLLAASHQNVYTTGTFYATLERSEWGLKCESSLCPVCKDHDLEAIPFEERRVETVEAICEQYDHVDWSREHLSPFLVSKKTLTNLPTPSYNSPSMPTEATPSPPS